MGFNYGYYDNGYAPPQMDFSYQSGYRYAYPRNDYYMDRGYMTRPLNRAFRSLETPGLDGGYDYPAYMPRHGRRFHHEPEPFWGRSRGNSWGIDYDGESIGLSFLGRYSHSSFGLNLRLPLNREPQEEQAPPSPPPVHEVNLIFSTPKAPAEPPKVEIPPPPAEEQKGKPASPMTSVAPAPPKPQKSPEEIRAGLDKKYERVKSLMAKADQCGVGIGGLEAKDQTFLKNYFTTAERKGLIERLIRYTRLVLKNTNLSDEEKTNLNNKLTEYNNDLDALKKHTAKND